MLIPAQWLLPAQSGAAAVGGRAEVAQPKTRAVSAIELLGRAGYGTGIISRQSNEVMFTSESEEAVRNDIAGLRLPPMDTLAPLLNKNEVCFVEDGRSDRLVAYFGGKFEPLLIIDPRPSGIYGHSTYRPGRPVFLEPKGWNNYRLSGCPEGLKAVSRYELYHRHQLANRSRTYL